MSGRARWLARLTVISVPRGSRRSTVRLPLAMLAILVAASMTLCGCESAGGRGGATPADDSDGGDFAPEDDDVAREIEEADIVKYQDGYFYLANRYRGLRIIDARTIERPEIVGGVSMKGRGVELYVDEDRAYVVTSADYYTCAGEPVSFKDAGVASDFLSPDYQGSRLTVADVSDRTDPFEISHFDMDGFIVATRRVGEVVYAVGDYEGFAEAPSEAEEEAEADGDETEDGDAPDQDDEAPLPPSSTGEAATVDETGAALASATSPAGFVTQVTVSEAEPDRFLQVTAADGNLRNVTDGLPEDLLLPATASVNSDLEEGAFTAVVFMWPNAADLDALELSTFDLGIYRFDELPGAWVPAATNNVGVSPPTETVGDFGYHEQTGEAGLAIWAVVDRLGDFAMGLWVGDELTIEIVDSDGGTVVVDPDQETYTYGTVVTLTAVAEEEFRFVEWSPPPPPPASSTAASVEVILAQDLQIGAVFEPIPPQELGPQVFVISINIADPDDIHIVDRVSVTGDSLDIHVTESAIYVLGDDPSMSSTTRVTYVDISDPAGDITIGDTFRVPGLIENRFFADEYAGVFRIVTEDRSLSAFNPVVALYLYDLGDPDYVRRIGQLTINTGESLRSVRFDGPRGYAVTFRQIDPLFVLDLADPTDPVVAGELEVPGWSTHLVPLGDRLVGVGFDDRRGFRPAVALYDVSNPARPRPMTRIVLGEKWTFDTSSEATVDEKALKVLEEEELILIPYSSYSADQGRFVDSLQLIDLNPGSLIERGFIDHPGLVRRAGVTDTRLWVLSDEAFQVAKIDDRDDVQSIASVEIMSEQDLLDAGLSDCADSARFHGFEIFDFVVWDGEPIVLAPARGMCGAVGLIGLLLTPLGLLAMRMGPRRRK